MMPLKGLCLAKAKTMRALFVEDNGPTRHLIETYLGGFDVECVTASDGREAMRLVKVEDFDIILLDILMPECDGVEFLLWLKRQGRTIPTCVISQKVERQTDGMSYGLIAEGLGAIRGFQKPVTQEMIGEALAAARSFKIANDPNGFVAER